MIRSRAKKRLKYYQRIYRKSETGNDVDISRRINKLQVKKFSTLPRRIRRSRLHITGRHLCDWLKEDVEEDGNQ